MDVDPPTLVEPPHSLSSPGREESQETQDASFNGPSKPSLLEILTPYLLRTDATEEIVERVLSQSKALAASREPDLLALEINPAYYERDVNKSSFDNLMQVIHTREVERKQKYEDLLQRYWTYNLAWAEHRTQIDFSRTQNSAEKSLPETPVIDASNRLGETPRRLTRSNTAIPRSDYVPEAEMTNAYDWIMTNDDKDPTLRGHKSHIEPPDMLLPKFDRPDNLVDTHTFVADPVTFYQNETARVEWTEEECTTFYQAFQRHTKNFGKIAELLPGRSIEDVIRFYYQKKSIFKWRELAKKGKKGNGGKRGSRLGPSKPRGKMLANLKRRKGSDDEDDQAMSPLPQSTPTMQAPDAGTPITADENVDELEDPSTPNPDASNSTLSSTAEVNLPGPTLHNWNAGAPEEAAANTFTLHLPPVPSVIPPSVNNRSRKRPRAEDEVASKDALNTPVKSGAQSSTPSGSKRVSSYWSLKEKEDYHDGLLKYGEDFERIAASIGTKTAQQCRNMFNRGEIITAASTFRLA
ncbi:hypothetical protein BT69DRAFT_929330 [Atractiella rhizophila]|nr:hypothetical protein BT69DRAFT_929330 [Atractiella rhizophila]